MKIIVNRETSVVRYHLPDWVYIDLTEEMAEIGESGRPAELFFEDVNSVNATTYENITLPDDYEDNKYRYDGLVWTMVDGWTEPTSEPIEDHIENIATASEESASEESAAE